MSITYTYEIISVDQAARCMEVVYTAEGRQTLHIGTRLPFEGEAIEDVIEMYSPVAYWLEQEKVVQVPSVGTSGTIVPRAPEPQQPQPLATQPSGEIPQAIL